MKTEQKLVTEPRLVTVPGTDKEIVDIANMVRLSKTYVSNGDLIEFYAAQYASECGIKIAEPRFFSVKHGKRESISYYKSGFIVSGTDVYCHNAPIRRRTAYMLVWDEDTKRWMTWHLENVSSINQGKRLIDRTLATGILP